MSNYCKYKCLYKYRCLETELFMSKPDEDTFYDLKKDELILIAEHLQLQVKKAMRKDQIQHMIMKYLIIVKAFKEIMETMSETYEEKKKEKDKKSWREKKRKDKKGWRERKWNDKKG